MLSQSQISTPSAKSSKTTSSSSDYPPGTPKPPFEPPRRRSSLAFSQIISKIPRLTRSPVKGTDSFPEEPPETPATPANIGRQRHARSRGHESAASPGHVAKMQKLFSNAQASLQLDMKFATSPSGSIDSHLPSNHGSEVKGVSEMASQEQGPHGKSESAWRYSTLPFALDDFDLDVREPLIEDSSLLPSFEEDAQDNHRMAVEPISSGFTSPAEKRFDQCMEDAPLMMDCLGSSPPDVPLNLHQNTFHERHADSDDEAQIKGAVTDLEEPMSNLKFEQTSTHCLPGSDVKESPIVTHQKRKSREEIPHERKASSTESEIFLSRPAKAAAESAKAKRGIMSPQSKLHASEDTPISDGAGSVIPCPDPAAHGICPDPSAHRRRHRSGYFPLMRITPTPYPMRGPLSPSPLGGSFQPPMAHVHRADASGSPMLLSKVKASPKSPELVHLPARLSGGYGPDQNELHRPDPPARVDTEHFQPGWYYSKPRHILDQKPTPLKYAFSTAAAKIVGSSQAPESRIRDSYRTDTLTPLAKPTVRYRKNGIGALAGRGVSKYYGQYEPNHGIKRASRMTAGPSDRTDRPRFMSSPPRPVGPLPRVSGPTRRRSKRKRTRVAKSGGVEIVEDDTRATGARSSAASLHDPSGIHDASTNTSLIGSVMEIDEDIREAVRLSIIQNGSDRVTPKRTSKIKETNEADDVEMKELSPNVAVYRRNTGPRKRRRNSYWDTDLSEVSESPASEGRVDVKGEGKASGGVRARERATMSSPLKKAVDMDEDVGEAAHGGIGRYADDDEQDEREDGKENHPMDSEKMDVSLEDIVEKGKGDGNAMEINDKESIKATA